MPESVDILWLTREHLAPALALGILIALETAAPLFKGRRRRLPHILTNLGVEQDNGQQCFDPSRRFEQA